MRRNKPYRQSPRRAEGTYVELDLDTQEYCVFGDDSGFAYASVADKGNAEDFSDDHNRSLGAGK